MKRITALLLCLAMLAAMLAGCAGEDDPYIPTGDAMLAKDADISTTAPEEEGPEQELTMVYDPNSSLHPYKTADNTNRTLFSLIYQSLFVTDKDYNVHPMLCESYTMSEDMETYIFRLADATFSDGWPMTAADVVASLRAAEASKIYESRFFYVSDVYASGPMEVTIELDVGYENLPLLLDIPILKATELESERPLGTGPYMLNSTAVGLRLLRRNNWWCESQDLVVTTSAITLVEAGTPAQVRDEFEFEDVGLVCADPGSDNYADYRCDYELWDSENGMFLYIGFNYESEIFENQEVRAALTYAIDRERIVEEYYRGFAWAATLPCSPQSPYYNSGLAANYEYDPERFRTALSNAGQLDSEIRLVVNSDDSLRLRVARAISEMLEACGLKVKIIEEYGSNWIYVLRDRAYDIYLGQTKLSPNMDLSAFFHPWGTLSYGAMDDTATYEMCKQALTNSGNFHNLHEKIMNEGRLCPILFRAYAVYATRGLLTGLDPSRDNVFFYTRGLTMRQALENYNQQPETTAPSAGE